LYDKPLLRLYVIYRAGVLPPGVTKEDLIYAKKLYESSFHPDSGELQNVIGRMSCQVPGGMILTGAMLQWYKLVLQYMLQLYKLVLQYMLQWYKLVLQYMLQWYEYSAMSSIIL